MENKTHEQLDLFGKEKDKQKYTLPELPKTSKAHCLFEQSGTFKNEFKKLGYQAFDYDILDDFGETDYKIDLYAEIDKSFGGGAIYI